MIQKNFTRKSLLVIVFATMLGLYGATIAFALPINPLGYLPGETLNPACMPGQSIVNNDVVNCVVQTVNLYSQDGVLNSNRIIDLDDQTLDFINPFAVYFRNQNTGIPFVVFEDVGIGSSISVAADYYGGDVSWLFSSSNGDSILIGGFENGTGGNNAVIADGIDTLNISPLEIYISNISQDDTQNAVLVQDNNGRLFYRDASTLGAYEMYNENYVQIQQPNVITGSNAVAIGRGHSVTSSFGAALGGTDNTVAGVSSAAIGGNGLTVTGTSSFIAGENNQSHGSFATITGGESNEITIDGGGATISGGIGNIVSAPNATISGGFGNVARSYIEWVGGSRGTDYMPFDVIGFDGRDRLFNIGNSEGPLDPRSDAFTILKNGQTGIGIDNFEASTNGSIFQVGDGTTAIIGWVTNGTGVWASISDERKKDNIRNLEYGLDTVNELSPKSYTMKSNGQESIGFLAQDVLPIIPEAVFGSQEQGYGMAYQVITPVLVNAIQELDLKFSTIEALSGVDTESFFERITTLVQDTIADMTEIIVQLVKADRIETQELCVDGECFTGDDIRVLKEMVGERAGAVTENVDEQTETQNEEADEVQEEIIEDEEGVEEELPEEESVQDEALVEESDEEDETAIEEPVEEETQESTPVVE